MEIGDYISEDSEFSEYKVAYIQKNNRQYVEYCVIDLEDNSLHIIREPKIFNFNIRP